MPGSMDGLALAHFVRDRWPPVKIVATSGFAPIAEALLPEGGRFISRPYSKDKSPGRFVIDRRLSVGLGL